MENEGKKNRKNAISLLIFLSVFACLLVMFFDDSGNFFESNSRSQNLDKVSKNNSGFELGGNEDIRDWQEVDLVKSEKPEEPLRITESEINRMVNLSGQFAEMLPQGKTSNSAFFSMDKETQVDLVNFAQGLEYREMEELEKFMVESRDREIEVYSEESGQVEGIADSIKDLIDRLRDFLVGTCEDPAHEIFQPQLFCGAEDLTGGEEIRIAQIWAVDIKSVGSATGFDNLLLTHNPDGLTAWRNDSNVIMEDFDYFINMPPNHPSAPLLDSVVLPEDERFEEYEMHYEAAGSLNEIPYDVHPEEKSLCPDVLNPGHFNVKGSNNLEKELTDSISPPGLMSLGERSFPINLCEDPFFREDFDEEETFLLCNEGFFDILKCVGQNILKFTDTCPEIEGVFVDAALGSGQICNEADCSSRYWEAGRELASPPTWMEELHHPSMTRDDRENDYSANHPDETVIFTTPCYLRIDCEICLTKCFWDVSLLKHIFEQESKYTYPGFRNAPDIEDYLDAIVDEIKYRGRFGSIRY